MSHHLLDYVVATLFPSFQSSKYLNFLRAHTRLPCSYIFTMRWCKTQAEFLNFFVWNKLKIKHEKEK